MAAGAEPDSIDPNDDQFVAQEFDDDNVEPDLDVEGYGPDHGLAAFEASVVTTSGDVPADSLAERAWREEPDRLTPSSDGMDGELIEARPDWGFDPEFSAESAAEFAHEMPDGVAVGETGGPLDAVLPAEEAAIHVIDGEDDRAD